MLKGKKILLGVTGSIAAYKAANLVRLLTKAGAEVKVILTPAAKEFVSPLTLSTLSHHRVLIDLVHNDTWENHAILGRWADIMLIAPLSCQTLAKMASGHCDNLLMAVAIATESGIDPIDIAAILPTLTGAVGRLGASFPVGTSRIAASNRRIVAAIDNGTVPESHGYALAALSRAMMCLN